MKGLKAVIGSIALLASANAMATPVSGSSLQDIINGLYTAGGSNTALAPDVNADQAAEDGKFKIEASGASVATFIVSIAGNTNIFGIYDLNDTSKRLELFNSTTASAGNLRYVNVDDQNNFEVVGIGSAQFSSSVFGFYLQSDNTFWYSDPTRNGGDDHMVAYRGDGDTIKIGNRAAGAWGSSSYILAWEDVALAGSDRDYNDLVAYVESIGPVVPEPATLGLLGLGLAGVGFARRRQVK